MSELVVENELFQEINHNEEMEIEGGVFEIIEKYAYDYVIGEVLHQIASASGELVKRAANHFENQAEDIKNGKYVTPSFHC